MIAALILGRKGSQGLPSKNLWPILNRPLAWYPLTAALQAQSVDKVFMSTDDKRLMQLAEDNGAEVIERPEHLCTAEALGEDAYGHGYEEICRRSGEKPELLVLLFCNAATLLSETIDEGVEVLRKNPDYDSAVTVSRYNMYSPVRARRVNDEGLLEPFVPLEKFGDDFVASCDRNCQGDVWFADVAISVVRTRNLENLDQGRPPQKWMGQRIYPLKQCGGLDVDEEWQIPIVEWWLRRHRFPVSEAEDGASQ
jgi:hypothetical protein